MRETASSFWPRRRVRTLAAEALGGSAEAAPTAQHAAVRAHDVLTVLAGAAAVAA